MAKRITFKCACGAKLKVPTERAGSKCRCPECGSELVVPGGATLTVGDAGVKEVVEPADSSPQARTSCPTCGAKIGDETVICTKCGTNVATGERLGGGARDLLSVDERLAARQEADRVGFASLVVGLIIKPGPTLATLRWQLSFGDQLVKMSVLWLFSLVAIGALGAMHTRYRDRVETTIRPTPKHTEIRPATFKGIAAGKNFALHVMPERPVVGESLTLELVWKDDPATSPLKVCVVPGMGMPKGERNFEAGKKLGFTVPECAEASILMRETVEGADDKLHNFSIKVFQPKKAEDVVKQARPVALGALIEVVKSVAMLILWTALLGIGATVMVGGADWLPLLAVVAFLQGVTNLAWIPVLPLYPVLGIPGIMLVEFGLRFWLLALYLFMMMNLYDLDVRNGVMLTFFAAGLVYGAEFCVRVYMAT